MQPEKLDLLDSPGKLYDYLLISLSQRFNERDKDVFQFSFRYILPMQVLETQKPLKWFQSLEHRMELSWRNVNSLVGFLKEASRDELLSVIRDYQARIGIIKFFQKHLQAKFPEIRLKEELKRKWSSKNNLAKNYLRKCRKMLRESDLPINSDLSINRVRSLFSKGVILLVKSCSPICSPPSSDASHLVCLKLLYLADLFYDRFKGMIIDHEELLNIKPLPSGKFLALDNRSLIRGQTSCNPGFKPVMHAQAHHEISNRRRSSCEVFGFHMRLCSMFLRGFF
ncbi:uncharacterized protein LOC114527781 [Dendronephthya gigantea]|uniref:uncharacterized protein LOC114527781 n=1 Tax=Dendronephthya gigantea TaxID=151771 RepID=UPI001069AE8C|nr:uncharacterized protein LOC114527781 [Dendronephthya gigantea]